MVVHVNEKIVSPHWQSFTGAMDKRALLMPFHTNAHYKLQHTYMVKIAITNSQHQTTAQQNCVMQNIRFNDVSSIRIYDNIPQLLEFPLKNEINAHFNSTRISQKSCQNLYAFLYCPKVLIVLT